VDGTESQDEAAAEDAPTSPDASLARHHEPANDIFDDAPMVSHYERYTAAFAHYGGRS
jgi:hypothetical protein